MFRRLNTFRLPSDLIVTPLPRFPHATALFDESAELHVKIPLSLAVRQGALGAAKIKRCHFSMTL